VLGGSQTNGCKTVTCDDKKREKDEQKSLSRLEKIAAPSKQY
jgi:hypothetical protein